MVAVTPVASVTLPGNLYVELKGIGYGGRILASAADCFFPSESYAFLSIELENAVLNGGKLGIALVSVESGLESEVGAGNSICRVNEILCKICLVGLVAVADRKIFELERATLTTQSPEHRVHIRSYVLRAASDSSCDDRLTLLYGGDHALVSRRPYDLNAVLAKCEILVIVPAALIKAFSLITCSDSRACALEFYLIVVSTKAEIKLTVPSAAGNVNSVALLKKLNVKLNGVYLVSAILKSLDVSRIKTHTVALLKEKLSVLKKRGRGCAEPSAVTLTTAVSVERKLGIEYRADICRKELSVIKAFLKRCGILASVRLFGSVVKSLGEGLASVGESYVVKLHRAVLATPDERSCVFVVSLIIVRGSCTLNDDFIAVLYG